jgi:hypothetical protein
MYSGLFGINLHKSGANSTYVNTWSAGCQVFGVESDFNEMMSKANNAKGLGQKYFSYFLINKKSFDADGIVDNSSNTQYTPQTSENNGENSSNSTNGNSTNDILPSNEVKNLGDSNTDTTSTANNSYGAVSSSSSFGLKTIFGSVFPDDNNNRYINMSSEDISIIQYSEPNIKVDELNISSSSYSSMGVVPDKIAYHIPVVFINNFMIPQTNITNFCLDYSSFIPQVMVEFVDMKNDMLSTNIPKPGSYIKVLIGGYGDEKYYKPIRQDFVITNITKTNKTCGEYQNYRNSNNPMK